MIAQPKLRKSQRSTQRRLRFEKNKAMRVLGARYERQFNARWRTAGLDTAVMGRYILRGKEPVRCNRIVKWGRWLENESHHVGVDVVNGATVSTVFLGIDHGYKTTMPVLFETMIFEGPRNGEQYRYTTWDEARANHVRIVEAIRSTT